MVAAPLAPMFVGVLDPRVLGVIVGGFVCATTLKTLLRAMMVRSGTVSFAYFLLAASVAASVVSAIRESMKMKSKAKA